MTSPTPPPSRARRTVRRAARLLRRLLVLGGGDRLIARFGAGRGGVLFDKLRPTIESYPRGTLRRIHRDGLTLVLDPSDYTHWLAYFGVEQALRRRLYALARPGDTVVDVGTNIGEVLLCLARAVAPGGRAIGFEANPATHRLAMQNLALNPGLAAEVHAVGLGSAAAELAFGARSERNSGGDSILPPGAGTLTVPVVRLDDFLAERSIASVALVKIDVEGHELHVLRGAERAVCNHRPALFIELCDANLRAHGDSAAALLGWLEERGYATLDAVSGAPVRSSDALDGCFTDIIARAGG